jgi:hypothetical protein
MRLVRQPDDPDTSRLVLYCVFPVQGIRRCVIHAGMLLVLVDADQVALLPVQQETPAGHEFWTPDGKIIWYDLQTPRGEKFWLAGLVLATGEKRRYKLERDQWSVHYNVSPDGKLFAGDGGGPQMVAKAKDGQWIYLLRPGNGVLHWERLLNTAKHDYRLEPNVSFTPDG